MPAKTKSQESSTENKAKREKKPFVLESIVLATLPDFQRIPTDLVALNLVTRGGLPIGTNTLLSGKEASGKTVTVTSALANYLRMFPDKLCVFINADNKLSPEGLALRNGDASRVHILPPKTAVEAQSILCEIAEERPDVGIIVIDMLASMTSDREEIGGQEMGIRASENNKFYRKFTFEQLKRAAKKNPLTMLCTTQDSYSMDKYPTRFVPGGKGQAFAAACWIEYDKSEIFFDKTTAIPVVEKFKYKLRKNQDGLVRQGLESSMVISPFGRWKVGDFIDHQFIFAWALNMGLLKNVGPKGFEYEGMSKLKSQWVSYLEEESEVYATLTAKTIEAYVQWRKGERKVPFMSNEKPAAEEEASDEAELAAS